MKLELKEEQLAEQLDSGAIAVISVAGGSCVEVTVVEAGVTVAGVLTFVGESRGNSYRFSLSDVVQVVKTEHRFLEPLGIRTQAIKTLNGLINVAKANGEVVDEDFVRYHWFRTTSALNWFKEWTKLSRYLTVRREYEYNQAKSGAHTRSVPEPRTNTIDMLVHFAEVDDGGEQ